MGAAHCAGAGAGGDCKGGRLSKKFLLAANKHRPLNFPTVFLRQNVGRVRPLRLTGRGCRHRDIPAAVGQSRLVSVYLGRRREVQ